MPAGQSAQYVSATDAVLKIVTVAGENRPAVEYRVINHTADAVTAWKVRIRCHLSNGQITEGANTRDGFGAFAGVDSDPEQNRFIPGFGSISDFMLVNVPDGATVVSIVAIVEMAIFSDASWTGDRDDVNRVFGYRDQERVVAGDIVRVLREALATASGRNAIRLALQELNRKDQHDYDHPQKKATRRNLQLILDPDPRLDVDPDDFLKQWLARNERLYNAADAHRRPSAQRK